MKTKHIAFAVALFASITLVGSFLYLKSIKITPPNKEVAHVQQQKISDPLQELFQEEINEAQEPKTEDPLLKILGILEENSPSEALKADFLTPELKKFSQQKSASLQSCMQSVSIENIVKGKVNAFYNPDGDLSPWKNADGTINKTKLQSNLAPVFGQAVKNSSLNWIYEEKYFQYTFLMPEGDESLWYCYFTQESPFFKAFFGQVSFEIDPSKTTIPTVTPTTTVLPITTPTPEATPITTPTPLPCDRNTGGEGCFGQTWDGRWWTLEEEKKGLVLDLIGRRAALFHPSKAEYIKPNKSKGDIIAIFSTPGSSETFWGCGREPNIIATTKLPVNPELIIGYNSRTKLDMSGKLVTCDFSQSLRGDVTYMLRLPVVKGRFSKTTVQISGIMMRDEWGAWFSALSLSPDTTIAYSNTSTTPTGEPDGCVKLGGTATYAPSTCQYLNTAITKYSTTEDTMLYLKLQAAPSRAFSNGWTGTPNSECGKEGLKGHMYMVAW